MLHSLNYKLNVQNHKCSKAPSRWHLLHTFSVLPCWPTPPNHVLEHRYMHGKYLPRLSLLLGPHLRDIAPDSNGHPGQPPLHLSLSLSISVSPTLVMKYSTKSDAVPQRGRYISHRPLCFELHLLFIGEGLQRYSSAPRSITYMIISLTSSTLSLSLSLPVVFPLSLVAPSKSRFFQSWIFSPLHNPHSFHSLRDHCSALIVNFWTLLWLTLLEKVTPLMLGLLFKGRESRGWHTAAHCDLIAD